MQFVKGQHVRTNEQGRQYYDDNRKNIEGVVVYTVGSCVCVRHGDAPQDTVVMYDNTLEATNTPRRGA